MKKLFITAIIAILCVSAFGQLDIVKRDLTATRQITIRDTALYDFVKRHGGSITLTTTGTSGAATLIGGVLNIPQYSGGGGGTITSDSLNFSSDLLYWDRPNRTYKSYTSKPVGVGFYTGTTNPDGTTRLNLNGKLYSTGFYSFGGTSNAGVFNVTGTEDIVKFQKSSTDQVTIDTNGQLNTKAVSSYTTGNTITTQSTNGYAINAFVTGSGSPALLSQNGSVSNGSSLLQIQRVVSGSGNVTGDVISITDNPTTSGTISGKVFTATIGTTERISMNPRVADGATAVAYIEDTHNALTTAGAKLKSWKNQGTEKLSIDKDGNIEITTASQGIILKSPDGTRYKVTVANGGTLTVTSL